MIVKKVIRRKITTVNHELNDLNPVLRDIYLARGVSKLSEINNNKTDLLTYHDLKGITDSTILLAEKIIKKQSILIVGDYDADGATSTALCMRFLADLNHYNVNYLVPNRINDGYGLTKEIVMRATEYDPDLIVTVDNGITSIEGVSAARELGIDVLITDHHLPGAILPNANAIVNPNQPGCEFKSKNLAGVGVIFYVFCALRAHLVESNWFEENKVNKPRMLNYLDLVALGTVADVVPLDQNNRTLVQLGLNNIHQGNCSLGISALAFIAKKNTKKLIASDFGFAIAPRLNAAGRLDDMSLGIKCLIAPDNAEALSFANELNSLNEKRKSIETSMKQDAMEVLTKMNVDFDNFANGVCLYNNNWHEGVIGIVASRIKELYNRPTFIFTSSKEKGIIKGSARSIQGIHIKDLLENIAAIEPKLIIKFGGHAMAAGLSINLSDFDRFKMLFIQQVSTMVTKEILSNDLLTDGEIDTDLIDLELATKLQYGGPWGQHFPEPCFDENFLVTDSYLLHGKHIKMSLESNGRTFQAIAFNVPQDLQQDYQGKTIHAVFKININDYYNVEEVQFIIEQFTLIS